MTTHYIHGVVIPTSTILVHFLEMANAHGIHRHDSSLINRERKEIPSNSSKSQDAPLLSLCSLSLCSLILN